MNEEGAQRPNGRKREPAFPQGCEVLAGLLCATEVAGGYETVLGLLTPGQVWSRATTAAGSLSCPLQDELQPAGAAGTAEALPGAAAGTQTLPAVRTSLQRITVSSAGANSWNN